MSADHLASLDGAIANATIEQLPALALALSARLVTISARMSDALAKQPKDEPVRTLTVGQAAILYGVSEKTIYRMVHSGQLRGVWRVGHQIRLSHDHLVAAFGDSGHDYGRQPVRVRRRRSKLPPLVMKRDLSGWHE